MSEIHSENRRHVVQLFFPAEVSNGSVSQCIPVDHTGEENN